jgi:glycine oxidase
LAPSFEHDGSGSADLYRFGVRSLVLWREFSSALECDAAMAIDYRPYGIIGAAISDDDVARLKSAHDTLREADANIEWLSGDDVRAREPALSQTIAAGLWAPDDGQVDPRLTLAALRRVVLAAGGSFEDAAASGVAFAGERPAVELQSGRRLDVDSVVVAAGAFVDRLRIAAPVPEVFPVKGEAVALATNDFAMRSVVRAPGAYLCPKSDGRLVIGATETPHDSSLRPTEAGVASLRRQAAVAAPGVERLRELERWAGLRPATTDGAPVIGRDPRGPASLYFALGHYRNGILWAPETARMLASWILDGQSGDVAAAFRPERFAL